ncbi:myosin light chain kinase, smooth muscle-like [Larimichthys crocea]|uniref:myosin light chain kinase, smooth muscle-like n=1 Tax=Larimichthys crocea TaxID=215358 RepID=UPI000F5E6FCB|nr:myosin light chain kinase, smooth muscle-like [Larimichthys crocea]
METGCRSAVPAVEYRPTIWGESPPKFITKPSRVFAKLGQTGKFIAKATGRPQPRVTWHKGEAELLSCGRRHTYERSGLHFLEIQEVCAEDAGSYTCLVTNSAGKATATATLHVQGVPDDSSRTLQPAEEHNRPGARSSLAPHSLQVSGPERRKQNSLSQPGGQSSLLEEQTSCPVCLQFWSGSLWSVQQLPEQLDKQQGCEEVGVGVRVQLRFEAVPLDQEATEGAQVHLHLSGDSTG